MFFNQVGISQEGLAKMPKKPLNQYLIFRKEMYPEISKMNPQNTMTEVSQMIAEIWSGMTQEERQVYQNKSLQEHQIYLEEYKKWQQEFNVNDEDVKQYRKQKSMYKQNQRIRKQEKQKTRESTQLQQKQENEEDELDVVQQKILNLEQKISLLKINVQNEKQDIRNQKQK